MSEPYVTLPISVLKRKDLPPAAKCVFAAIDVARDDPARLKVVTIAMLTGLGPRTVERHLATLRKLGVVKTA